MSYFVFVVSNQGKPLSPCTIERALSLHKAKKGTFFYRRHLLCIRLNYSVCTHVVTNYCTVGLDTGSKFSGLSVGDYSRTYLNLLLNVGKFKLLKGKLETRRELRRGRRYRNTPRKARFNNRSREGFVPPSTKARWNYYYNTIKVLTGILPITTCCIEDVQAVTKKGGKKWNSNFSVVQNGKNFLYTKLKKERLEVKLFHGYTTKELRDSYSLPKNKDKGKQCFYSHNVDAWVLLQTEYNNLSKPDNLTLHTSTYTSSNRRQLHASLYKKNHYRVCKKANIGSPPKWLLTSERSTGTYNRKTGNYVELLTSITTKKQERLGSLQVKSFSKVFYTRL